MIDADLQAILAEALKSVKRSQKERQFNSLSARKRANRIEFEKRFRERLSAQNHSVRIALNEDPFDALRFRHWFIHMRFTQLPSCIAEWRKMIDRDILNKKELSDGQV